MEIHCRLFGQAGFSAVCPAGHRVTTTTAELTIEALFSMSFLKFSRASTCEHRSKPVTDEKDMLCWRGPIAFPHCKQLQSSSNQYKGSTIAIATPEP